MPNRPNRSQTVSFFEELKRRNVVRVGIAYVVVAWLILQVTDIILNNVEAPPWAFWLILVILGIGLVFALVFSWIFEMTPEGLKLEREVDRSQSITPQTGQKLNRLITGVLALAVVYFLIDKFVVHDHEPETYDLPAIVQAESGEATGSPSAPEQVEEKSIAVLPFVNMSEDASNEFFSDGISEEILNSLAKVKELKVAGRTSSFAFKGKNQDLRTIAEALGVQNILEGSVRKAGDTVRITAQLIKADDGFHLWSETYDRQLDDVFAIQDDIANAILAAMKATLLDETSNLLSATRTSAEAYELYLLAKQRSYERTGITIESAAELLDRAIALDPDYAPAYAQRGIVNLLLSETSYGTLPQDEAQAEAKRLLDRALDLDPELAEGWAGLGLYYNSQPGALENSIEVLEKALSINPNLNDAANWLALAYWGTNRAADAEAVLEGITERDPLYRPALGNWIFHLGTTGRTEQGREHIDSVEPFLGDEAQILQGRAWLDYFEGKLAAGLKRSELGLEKQPTDRVLKMSANEGNLRTHQYDRVFEDNYTGYYMTALLELGRNEEAGMIARQRGTSGEPEMLFYYLNRTGQSPQVIEYLEANWDSLEAFESEFPAGVWGYPEMLDIALAYRRIGNQAGFDEALQRLGKAVQKSVDEGMSGYWVAMNQAAYLALAGRREEALAALAKAIDEGFVSSLRIASEWPYLADLEGDPEYEAIQARMIEHLNRERQLLGLEPVSG
jgi:TolB-like protein